MLGILGGYRNCSCHANEFVCIRKHTGWLAHEQAEHKLCPVPPTCVCMTSLMLQLMNRGVYKQLRAAVLPVVVVVSSEAALASLGWHGLLPQHLARHRKGST